MKTYLIPEVNMPKLETALKRIKRKCDKYNCEFNVSVGEPVFHPEITDEGVHYIKYVPVSAEGVALADSGWEFIALITHRDEGNVIRQFNFNYEIPARFLKTSSTCDHCNTNRSRTETCLLHHRGSDEWKQVGKSCLKDFTGQLDAEHAALMATGLAALEKSAEWLSDEGIKHKKYYPVFRFLTCVNECINHWGYARSESENPTGRRAFRYYQIMEEGARASKTEEHDLQQVKFNSRTDANRDKVKAAIDWLLSIEQVDNYLGGLQSIVKSEYLRITECNYVASLIPTYNHYLETEAKKRARIDQEGSSKHIGQPGDKVSIAVVSASHITSWTDQFGVTNMYKFISAEGDVLIWTTQKSLDTDKVKGISGTVKRHDIYDGVNQTHLTRCKITEG